MICFTELALWADSVSKLRCPPVCLFHMPLRKTRFLVDWRLLVKGRIAYIGIPLDVFGFLLFP